MAERKGWFDVPLGAPTRQVVTTPEQAVEFINQTFGRPIEYYNSADSMRDIWRAMMTNGIVPEMRQSQSSAVSPQLQLGSAFSASIASGLNMIINNGIGWIDGAFFILDEPKEISLYPGQINDIVLRLDLTGSQIIYSIFAKQRPAGTIEAGLTRGGGVYELGLHSINVPSGTEQLTQAMFVDHRLNMNAGADGLPCCGIVGSLLMPDIDAWYQRAVSAIGDIMEQTIADGAVSISKLADDTRGCTTINATAAYAEGVYTLTPENPPMIFPDYFSVRFKTPSVFTQGDVFQIAGKIYTPTLSGSSDDVPAEIFIADKLITLDFDSAGATANFKPGGGGNPRPPKSWAFLQAIATTQNWTVPETGWYRVHVIGKGGDGGDGGRGAGTSSLSAHGGGGGGAAGSGGCSISTLYLTIDTQISISVTSVVSSFGNNITVTAGENGSAGAGGGPDKYGTGGLGGDGGVGVGGNVINLTGNAGNTGLHGGNTDYAIGGRGGAAGASLTVSAYYSTPPADAPLLQESPAVGTNGNNGELGTAGAPMLGGGGSGANGGGAKTPGSSYVSYAAGTGGIGAPGGVIIEKGA